MINVTVNIMQWNCQSVRPKSVELEALLNLEKIHIAVLSETWLEPQSHFRISSYNTYRLDRQDGYGGVAILTHESVKTTLCLSRCPNIGIELVHIKLLNCRHIENIISVYCPSTVRTTPNDWDYVFSLANRKTLVLGDFNAHHTNWTYRTDNRGYQIFDSILEHSFTSLNNRESTRLRLVNGVLQQSSPDISFVSADLVTLLSWKVSNESLGSDHRIINLSINLHIHSNIVKKRNFKMTDWNSYTSTIENLFINISNPVNTQEMYNLFESILQSAANRAIPYTKLPQHINDKFKPKPYWNSELSKAVAERRLALTNLRRNPSPANLVTLQEKIRNTQRAIRSAKCKSWQRFCTSIDETTSSPDMWLKMRWVKGHRGAGNKQHIDKDKAKELLNTLTPDYVCPPQPQFMSMNTNLESLITIQEVENSIKKTDTAPGIDEISFSMIEHLPLVAKEFLVKIYNSILNSGYVPTQWRQIKVIPIPKSGREVHSRPDFRLISLISCLCKIFHSILQKRLEWYFEKQSMFSDNMTGFRKSRSCYDNLARLVTHIQLGFSKNLMTAACFIDIENAYNNVNVSCLLSKLDQLRIGSKICVYLWGFLHNRQLKMVCEGSEITRTTGQGLAQGDPLSPLLFNAATIDICKNIQNVEISQYADDFVMYISKNKIEVAAAELRVACKELKHLLSTLGLVISSTKSKVCIFKKGRYRGSLDLKINNQSLPVVKHVQYLGLWLDGSLRWGKHINMTIEKVSKFINLLKVLSGPGWGIHQKHLRRLYISGIRSRIDYASFLYDNSCQTNLLKLDRSQNQALRAIGGFIRSTPIHVMENELCLPPLQYRRYYLGGKFYLKSKSLVNNSTLNILQKLTSLSSSRYWTNKKLPLLVKITNSLGSVVINSSVQLEMFSLKTWVSNINFKHVIFTSIPVIDRAKRSYSSHTLKTICTRFINEQYDGWHKIFTDGSKEKTGAGLAFLDPYFNVATKFRIDSDICIMHIELIAIAEALSYIETITFGKFVILCDSKSALQHLARCTSHRRGMSIAYQILESILKLQTYNKKVILQWIPSHINLKENDEVDILAKHAIIDGVPLEVLPNYSELVKEVKRQCKEMWQEYFNLRSRDKGIWYRTIQPHIPQYSWVEQNGLNRKVTQMALRLRSGHIPTNKFGYLMRKVPSPNCNVCNVVEDVQHVLMECARNAIGRRSLFNSQDLCVGLPNSVLAEPLSDKAKTLFGLADLALRDR